MIKYGMRNITGSFTRKVKYFFARSNSQSELLPEQLQDLIQEQSQVPSTAYQNLMIIPVRIPIFPQNSLVTQVHPLLRELIEQQKIKHLAAVLLNDNAEPYVMNEEEFKEYFKQLKQEEIQENTLPVKHQIATLLDNFHQNIMYDTAQAKMEIQFAHMISDFNQIGTICKVSTQRVEERGKPQEYLILKGIQRIQIIQKAQQKKISIIQDGSKFAQRLVDLRSEPLDNQNIVTHIKAQPLRDYSQQFVQDTNYKIKLSQLLGHYAQIRSKVPINVPELLNSPTDPSTIDILCGYLCLTTFFKRMELITLFTTLAIHQRLDLCLSYFERYAKELSTQWNEIEQKSTLPIDPKTQKLKMKEIYDFLKKQHASPQTAPFVEKILKQLEGRILPVQIQQLIQDEISQISEISENHPDFNIKRNFLELLVSLPFGLRTDDQISLKRSEEILSSSHFGLAQIKQRILEFLAVSKMRKSASGKSLLLVGPPGVGKTSIASTIAQCLNRKFVRISLGGESDTAIIKGHRKTYMASYPGKIVQALKQAQSGLINIQLSYLENPVILLDEVDKLGRSYRGNIFDALLEVLDPVQNSSFIDNYLEVPIDLSKVLFICSANLLETIPEPLLDRMELIQLFGYTIEEKIQIAQTHLIPKIIEEIGLRPYFEGNLKLDVIRHIIQYYCRESGVRSLQRTLHKLFEKLVIQVVKSKQAHSEQPTLTVDIEILEKLIGQPQFDDVGVRKTSPGLGVGLAYNQYGGSLMYIEIVRMNFLIKEEKTQTNSVVIEDIKQPQSSGQLRVTGQLGETIKESVQIAYTHAKSILHKYFENHYLQENSLHMHFPAGAVKKDGPSAGIAIASALVSIAINQPIKEKTAMTGEISLTGKVLKIGGLKEKVLAAKREGIEHILIPIGNQGDFEELPANLKEGIRFYLVEEFWEVVNILFDKNINVY